MNTTAVVERIKLLDRRYRAMDEAICRWIAQPNRVNEKRVAFYSRRYQDLVNSYDPVALGIEEARDES